MRVIAVDPDRTGLAALIQSVGAVHPDSTVVAFDDPLMAVKHAYNNPVDAVYTVISMNRLDGFGLARMLRKEFPLIELNFISADTGAKADAMRFGMNSYTVSPITPEKLRAAENEQW